MKQPVFIILDFALILAILLGGCQPAQPTPTSNSGGSGYTIQVVAAETFLADIAQNVAGNRAKVDSLIPIGLDPHEFEPSPTDIVKIANCQVLIVNGAGLEGWLQRTLDNAGGKHIVVIASDGLKNRTPKPGELQPTAGNSTEIDPHFWMDPINAIKYTENIRDGLIQADPAGENAYTQNATDYIAKLNDLDRWIKSQVNQIPSDRRLLVTNHDSLGYFADRYGFRIMGTIIPGFSSDASPSAQQMATLIDTIRKTHVQAIFLEKGSNTQLADQIAQETGVKVITDLYEHSVSPPGGPAPDYISMIKFNTQTIVDALK
jgi:ABC-type Zn uptake system ZnuABC Zn-binding protein ZnuA